MLILDGEHAAVALAFTPDSTRLLSAASDGRLDLWTLSEGELVMLRGVPTVPPAPPAPPTPSWLRPPRTPVLTAEAFALHPFGQVAHVGGLSAFTAVSLTGRPDRVCAAVELVRTVLVSGDGKWVVVRPTEGNRLLGFRCADDGTLTAVPAWEVAGLESDELPGGFVNVGERFVAVGNQVLVVRESATGEALFTVPQPAYSVARRGASPDGTRFAIMNNDRLYLWDTTGWGKPVPIEGNSTWPFVAFAFHPARPLLAVVQRGQQFVKFFDWNTAKLVAKYRWELGEMTSVTFSPDGTLAAACAKNGKIVVWDLDE